MVHKGAIAKKYRIHLSEEERKELAELVRINMAKIEIGAAQLQCMNRRIATQKPWSKNSKPGLNAQQCGTDWRFTTCDARIKLKHLYPSTLLT